MITIYDTTMYWQVPLEVVWWLFWRWGLRAGDWVAMLTEKPKIVAATAVRAGVGLNVLWGIPFVEPDDVNDLNPYVSDLQGQIRVADGLPPVHWSQGINSTFSALVAFWLCRK